MKTNNYKEHTLQSFLETYNVVIPKVQRDYAQGRQTDDVRRVRDRFLEAIKKHLTAADPAERVMKMDFVYGEKEILSYFDDNDIKQERMVVTPLDGQQRLTTLYLLHWYAAKRDGIDRSEYRFLNNFTYDVRPSSVAFCKHLLDYQPDMSQPISDQLKDEFWFMGEWNQDPTVLGMLVMLDAIQTRFKDIPDLWHLLTDADERRIVFYFLPLSDNGLSDELYVKMNARGKKLTPFEHFKAEYEKLYAADSDKRTSVCHRMDVEWVDVLFPYRGQDDTTDSEFMRYFFYISHILCYQQGLELRDNPFDLIDLLYADKVTNAQDNRQFLEQAMDCWYDVMRDYGSIDAFFQKYLSCNEYEQGKVCTYKNSPEYVIPSDGTCIQNFFSGCIKLYWVNNSFSLGDFLFLYGILVYLIHRKSIEEGQFVDRIRILRNLIWNSDSGEIRRDYMKDLLNEVSTLMLTGEIRKEEKSVHGFNKDQEREEAEKMIAHQSMTDEVWNTMCRLEDHYLLYGRVAWLGYNNLHLADTFYQLFAQNDLRQIHKALISIGDYTQHNGNRYYMCNQNEATWKQWLHRNDKQSMEVLILLLEKVYAGQSLEDIVQAFLQEQDSNKTYSWRYYFAKYDQMQRGADGEYIWSENSDYKCIALNRHQLNGQHWDPYLNVIYQNSKDENGEPICSLENYGSDLQIPQQSVSLRISDTGEVYVLIREQEEKMVPIPVSIPHNESDGTDQVDRIERILQLIKEKGLQR